MSLRTQGEAIAQRSGCVRASGKAWGGGMALRGWGRAGASPCFRGFPAALSPPAPLRCAALSLPREATRIACGGSAGGARPKWRQGACPLPTISVESQRRCSE
eukprot:CAMPEP_0174922558 /NCGR_PEP_ID=MMETSP1355-20121228/5966_1 /TAXON_ID=464990 /ORGANISM="Hemiselmis tepida, Strain CCMP443" /LENGTH=102 /DNA_ID=CAMNT_0016168157 /DNA_START=10 /DNA_END=319 /DNA_ORIENTATION=+